MSDEVPSAWRSMPLRPTETGHVIRGMQSYYDDRAEEYDDWYRRINKHYDPSIEAQWHAEVAQLTQWIQAFGHGRLLEIASGTGWWTRHLARRAQVMTLDYAPAMIDVLRRRLRAENVSASPTRGDAYALPFAAGSFDCVFFGFWLSHVPFALLAEFCGEVNRVLRAGGEVLLVDSMAYHGEQPNVEWKQERILNDGSQHHIVKIYQTPDTLRAWLTAFGAEVRTWQTGKFFVLGRYTNRMQ